jgi:hypothetical protein
MPLREEIIELIDTCFDDYYNQIKAHDANDVADSILALIDGQRCRWTVKKIDDRFIYEHECGGWSSYWVLDMDEKHCMCCGHRIEVVEGEKGDDHVG